MFSNDCCADSKFAPPVKRFEESSRLLKTRLPFVCQETSQFDDRIEGLGFYIRASCSSKWLSENLRNTQTNPNEENVEAKSIRENCEYIRKKSFTDDKSQLRDPLGRMMYITDLVSGITYANSYCLQCNPINFNRSRLVQWLPKLNCYYDSNSDDEEKLINLVNYTKGTVLKYSESLQNWFIDIEENNQNKSSKTKSMESHICEIEPAMPESVEPFMRKCSQTLIDSCPIANKKKGPEADQAIRFGDSYGTISGINRTLVHECHRGYQALVYSRSSRRIFKNRACAYCNNDFDINCQLPKFFWKLIQKSFDTSLNLIFDFNGASNSDQQVSLKHQCEENQVWDSFHSRCHDVICGSNKHYEDGKCSDND